MSSLEWTREKRVEYTCVSMVGNEWGISSDRVDKKLERSVHAALRAASGGARGADGSMEEDGAEKKRRSGWAVGGSVRWRRCGVVRRRWAMCVSLEVSMICQPSLSSWMGMSPSPFAALGKEPPRPPLEITPSTSRGPARSPCCFFKSFSSGSRGVGVVLWNIVG